RWSCWRRACGCTSRSCPCLAPSTRWTGSPGTAGPAPPTHAHPHAHEAGGPGLGELRLHQGTVWRWNRAIYDPAGGGHLRVEMRALPAGPTVVDMLANAAFLVGLTLALAPDADAFIRRVAFQQVH